MLAILFLAVGLAMDAFAAALTQGTQASPRPRATDMLRVGLAFGTAQGLMPALGWWLGQAFERFIRDVDHWVAFVLLVAIGVSMIRAARSQSVDPVAAADPSAAPSTAPPPLLRPLPRLRPLPWQWCSGRCFGRCFGRSFGRCFGRPCLSRCSRLAAVRDGDRHQHRCGRRRCHACFPRPVDRGRLRRDRLRDARALYRRCLGRCCRRAGSGPSRPGVRRHRADRSRREDPDRAPRTSEADTTPTIRRPGPVTLPRARSLR